MATGEMTVADAFKAFRWQPGDVVCHKTVTAEYGGRPFGLVVIGRQMEELPVGVYIHRYVVRGVARRDDGAAAVCPDAWAFYEQELCDMAPEVERMAQEKRGASWGLVAEMLDAMRLPKSDDQNTPTPAPTGT